MVHHGFLLAPSTFTTDNRNEESSARKRKAMSPLRWAGCVLALLLACQEARAQIVVSYPWWAGSPASFYGGGVGFNYFGRRLAVRGFAGGAVVAPPYPIFPNGVFVSSYPFYGSFFPPAPWGIIDSRVTVNVVVPPIVVAPAGRLRDLLEEADDLAGVDLDVVGPEALEGKPARRRPPAPLRAAPEPARPAPKPDKAPPPFKQKEAARPAAPKLPRAEPPQPDLPPPRHDPKEESERLLKLGSEAFQNKFFGLAAFRFAQAVKAHPLDGSPYFLLSQAQFALGKYRDAVRTIEVGMKLQPKWPLMPFQKLDPYKNLEPEFVEHLKRLEATQAAAPKDADFLFLLAHVRWFAGQRDQAVILFRQARPNAPDPTFIDRFLQAAMPALLVAK
jgi:hypothetical protein